MNRQKGMTLLEMAIVLSIMVGVMSLSMSYLSPVVENSQANLNKLQSINDARMKTLNQYLPNQNDILLDND